MTAHIPHNIYIIDTIEPHEYNWVIPMAMDDARRQRLERVTISIDEGFDDYCHFRPNTLTLLYDGTCVLCPNDTMKKMPMGNIRGMNILQLYNSPKMAYYRRMVKQGKYEAIPLCKSCPHAKSLA